MKDVCSRLANVGLWLTSAVSASAVVIAVMFYCTGLRPIVVTSGSMAPKIPVGSLVIARQVPAAEVAPGDVVTVALSQTRRVTHRVVSSDTSEGTTRLVLKGDANEAVDIAPIVASKVLRMEDVYPNWGIPLIQLRGPLATIIAGSLLGIILLTVASRVRARMRPINHAALPSLGQDLRTPLTSIVGYSEMLCEGEIGPLDRRQQRALETVRRNADTLANLVRTIP